MLCLVASLSLACSQRLDFGKFIPGSSIGDAWTPDSSLDAKSLVDAGLPDSLISGCNPKSFSLKQAPPSEVYLVVDRSGSMLEKGTGSKVTALDLDDRAGAKHGEVGEGLVPSRVYYPQWIRPGKKGVTRSSWRGSTRTA